MILTWDKGRRCDGHTGGVPYWDFTMGLMSSSVLWYRSDLKGFAARISPVLCRRFKYGVLSREAPKTRRVSQAELVVVVTSFMTNDYLLYKISVYYSRI